MCRISVIIPVYNAEKYLSRCLDSVINQITNEDEILLIDDNSTDSSPSICEKYEKNYENIKYFRQEKNNGPSKARNLGLEKSEGKYIVFLDSDDFIEEKYFDIMLKYSQKYDLVICAYYLTNEDKKEKKKVMMQSKEINMTNILELLNNKEMLNTLWNKMYKSNIIKENKIFFDEKEKRGEDLLFNLDYISYVKNNIYVVDELLYNYIMKKEGLNLGTEETLIKRLERAKKFANKVKKIKNDKETKKMIIKNYIGHIYIWFKKIVKKLIRRGLIK